MKASDTGLKRCDAGSGTMLGASLILLAAVLLILIASVCRIVICQATARSAADTAALVSAFAAEHGSDSCAIAAEVTEGFGGRIIACQQDSSDMLVQVEINTDIPFFSKISQSSRAGPVRCCKISQDTLDCASPNF